MQTRSPASSMDHEERSRYVDYLARYICREQLAQGPLSIYVGHCPGCMGFWGVVASCRTAHQSADLEDRWIHGSRLLVQFRAWGERLESSRLHANRVGLHIGTTNGRIRRTHARDGVEPEGSSPAGRVILLLPTSAPSLHRAS